MKKEVRKMGEGHIEASPYRPCARLSPEGGTCLPQVLVPLTMTDNFENPEFQMGPGGW